jgi:hypothetical protein
MNLSYDLLEIEPSTSCFRTLIFERKDTRAKAPILMSYESRV